MRSRFPPELLDHLLDELAERVAERVYNRVSASDASSTAGAGWYDQQSSPLGKRRFLEAARRGAFPATRKGKLVLALRADVDAWITESTRAAPAANDERGAGRAEEDTDALLRSAGVLPGAAPPRKLVRGGR
jgi:hypothetical protein